MNRKKPCQQVVQDLFTTKTLNPHKNAQKRTDTAQKRTKTHKNLIYFENNQDVYNDDNINICNIKCDYCEQIFTRKDTLTRHLKKFCKEIIKQNDITNALNILNNKLEKVIEENEHLKEQIINTSNNKNTIIKTNSNNITNNQIIQNQQNNNIQIKMVSFGDEDINKLTEDEIHSILTSKSKAFINLIKAIHLNDRLPEYNNLLINNLRSDYCSIIEDNKLVIKNKNKTLTYLIDMRLSDLRDLINQYKTNKKLPKKDLEFLASVLEFLKTVNLEDEDIDGNIIKPEKSVLKNIKELYKELTYMFYDKRDIVTKNITKVSEEEMIAYLDV